MENILNLPHVVKELPDGGIVLVLNTGAVLTPEDTAMLQALHSRSVGGIRAHLEKLTKRGSGGFMEKYFVGYGDKSIGDCGTVTIFIEGVSMLAAKAIQDWPLYSGQESSTRYIDFSTQPFVDPVQTLASEAILERWREFYLEGLDILKEDLPRRFPIKPGDKKAEYRKAIRARAFDIMRGFLPAGAETNLSWHGNIRQTADKLMELRHHPLHEVRTIAAQIMSALREACPNSFNHKLYEQTESYNLHRMLHGYYFEREVPTIGLVVERDSIDRELLGEYLYALSSRPPKTELPKQIAECGTMRFGFMLDFGSFRDAQRHRGVIQRMPLVTTEHGFEPWYLNELPESLRRKAEALLEEQETAIAKLHPKEVRQYYVAMGYRLPNRLTGNLHGLVWLVELRATRFVHPTLRRRARQIAGVLDDQFSKFGFRLRLDEKPDIFDARRGAHDIVEKS